MGIASAIGGALALGGSIIGSKSQKKAANKAADTSLAVADKNNALAQNIYNQNKATLSPFVSRGNAAGDALNAMLSGAPTQTVQPTYQQQVRPNALSQFARPDDLRVTRGGFTNPSYAYGIGDGQAGLGGFYNVNTGGTFGGTQAAVPQQSAPSDPNAAFDVFRNNTGYQFRMDEALDATNSNYFGAGVGQSGAALKALQDRAGAVADNTFGQYAGLLGQQQGVGLSAAGAQAGVSTDFVNQTTANNNAAGTAAANAALAGGDNGFANALTQIGGTILGSKLG